MSHSVAIVSSRPATWPSGTGPRPGGAAGPGTPGRAWWCGPARRRPAPAPVAAGRAPRAISAPIIIVESGPGYAAERPPTAGRSRPAPCCPAANPPRVVTITCRESRTAAPLGQPLRRMSSSSVCVVEDQQPARHPAAAREPVPAAPPGTLPRSRPNCTARAVNWSAIIAGSSSASLYTRSFRWRGRARTRRPAESCRPRPCRAAPHRHRRLGGQRAGQFSRSASRPVKYGRWPGPSSSGALTGTAAGRHDRPPDRAQAAAGRKRTRPCRAAGPGLRLRFPNRSTPTTSDSNPGRSHSRTR